MSEGKVQEFKISHEKFREKYSTHEKMKISEITHDEKLWRETGTSRSATGLVVLPRDPTEERRGKGST